MAAVVRRITDHLLLHDYTLVDHDGAHTRWAVFGPRALNLTPRWIEERGLNSLSMLTYLRIAHHMTGESRYETAARSLVNEHGYAMNLADGRVEVVASGSDDALDQLAAWLRHGPPSARVDGVECEAIAEQAHAGFSTR